MSLVIWEICRRVSSNDDINNSFNSCSNELPYYEYVTREPSFEDMYNCVCVNNFRPTLEQEWQNSSVKKKLL